MSGPSKISGPAGYAPTVRRRRVATPGFEQALDRAVGVKFSKHANARVDSRGLTVDAAEQARLESALNELDRHGAQKALVLTDSNAFVVGVPKRTVITAMAREEAAGQVFTNIDSAFVSKG